MKKITVIITVAALAVVFAVAGCQKSETPKPAEQSAPTATTPAPTAPAGK